MYGSPTHATSGGLSAGFGPVETSTNPITDPPAPPCLLLASWAPQLAATRCNGRRVPASGKLLTSREIGSVQQPPAVRRKQRQHGPDQAVDRSIARLRSPSGRVHRFGALWRVRRSGAFGLSRERVARLAFLGSPSRVPRKCEHPAPPPRARPASHPAPLASSASRVLPSAFHRSRASARAVEAGDPSRFRGDSQARRKDSWAGSLVASA